MPNLCLNQKIFSNRVDAYPDYIDFTRISVKRLGRGTPDASTFKNRKSMVGCLQEDAPVKQGRNSGTAWVRVHDNSMVPGCATLATYSIDKKDIQVNQDDGTKIFPHGSIPATLIGQLATNKEYGNGRTGTLMVSPANDAANHLSEKIGCRVVALRPHEDFIGWHQKQAFEIIKREKKQDIVHFDILKK